MIRIDRIKNEGAERVLQFQTKKISVWLKNGARVERKYYQGNFFVVISYPDLREGREETVFSEDVVIAQNLTWIDFKPCVPKILDNFLELDYKDRYSQVVSIPLRIVESVGRICECIRF